MANEFTNKCKSKTEHCGLYEIERMWITRWQKDGSGGLPDYSLRILAIAGSCLKGDATDWSKMSLNISTYLLERRISLAGQHSPSMPKVPGSIPSLWLSNLS